VALPPRLSPQSQNDAFQWLELTQQIGPYLDPGLTVRVHHRVAPRRQDRRPLRRRLAAGGAVMAIEEAATSHFQGSS
jgi:hypothetical protein